MFGARRAAAAGYDREAAAVDRQSRLRLDSIVPGGNRKRAAVDQNPAFFRVFAVVGFDPVRPGIQGQIPIPDDDGVPSADGVIDRADGQVSADDRQVVFGGDAVSVIARDGQRTRAVDGQAVLDENGRVRLVFGRVGKLIFRRVGDFVFTSRGERENHFPRLLRVKRRGRRIFEADIVQHNPDGVLRPRVYHDLPVVKRPAEQIGARFGNRDGTPLGGRSAPLHRRGIPRQGDRRRRILVPLRVKVFLRIGIGGGQVPRVFLRR